MNQQSRQAIEDMLALTNIDIPVLGFIINLLIAGLLSFILSLVYLRYGHSLSNRKAFGRNFVLITMATMVIITIVKSSLALSLGLVGALSIVRFRSAIKEPEELSYLFISIAIGLGMGANQSLITILGFIIILGIIILRRLFSKNRGERINMMLTFTSPDPENTDIKQIISILEPLTSEIDLKRLDIKTDVLEAVFLVDIKEINQLSEIALKVKEYDNKISISYLDNRGLF